MGSREGIGGEEVVEQTHRQTLDAQVVASMLVSVISAQLCANEMFGILPQI